MKIFDIKEKDNAVTYKAQVGDEVRLTKQTLPVVKCEVSGVPMLNIDADQLVQGDLSFIKKIGLTISNPDTDRPVALGEDFEENSFGSKVAAFLGGLAVGEATDNDDNDDSGFFSGGSFGGGSSFGGFGGGGFSGGGASGSF